MKPLKNIKINEELHKKLAIKATECGAKKGEFTEKLLELALSGLEKMDNFVIENHNRRKTDKKD